MNCKATDDAGFMLLTKYVAKSSPHTGRKTSAVFTRYEKFLVAACNDFPDGVLCTPSRLQKPDCYLYIEHAERNAVAKAARDGICLKGSTVYLPWFPCVECARILVNAGVVRMVCIEPDWNDTQYHFNDSYRILYEGGIDIEYYTE
jgi:dCMP deaminase